MEDIRPLDTYYLIQNIHNQIFIHLDSISIAFTLNKNYISVPILIISNEKTDPAAPGLFPRFAYSFFFKEGSSGKEGKR